MTRYWRLTAPTSASCWTACPRGCCNDALSPESPETPDSPVSGVTSPSPCPDSAVSGVRSPPPAPIARFRGSRTGCSAPAGDLATLRSALLDRIRERPDLRGRLVAQGDLPIRRVDAESAAHHIHLPYLDVHARHQAAIEQVAEQRRGLPLCHLRDARHGGLHPLLQCRKPPLTGTEFRVPGNRVSV